MIDPRTHKPVRVLSGGTAGPYIMVAESLLERVREILQQNEIPHWVEHTLVSVDDQPFVAVINLGRKCDPASVQALLDNAS
jgi:hypothetical protein